MENLEIDKLGVYELRELARKLGVQSPTTKKIQQLKDEISLIYSGKLKVEQPSKRLGRPPKTLSRNKDDISSFLIPKDLADIIEQNKDSNEELAIKNMIFKSGEADFYGDFDKFENVCGYLRRTENNHFYFWTQNYNCFSKSLMVYVPDNIVKEYNLRVGDFVDAKVENYENYAMAVEIKKVNQSNSKERKTVDSQKFVLPHVSFELPFGEKMFLGGRAISVFDSRDAMAMNIIDYAKKVSKDKKVLFVGCEIPPELFAYIDGENITLFVSKFGDGLDVSYNVVVNAINHAQSLAFDNNEVVVIVYDILGILETMKLYFESQGQHMLNGVQMTKTLFGMGRAYEQNASITTIACIQKSEFQNEFISRELQKVASCVVGKY